MTQNSSIRLALSGSAGTGKTSLAKKLAAHYDLPYLDEGFRRRLENGLDPHKLSRDAFRNLMIELYDEGMSEVKAAIQEDGGFVADRGPMDYLAFWLYYGFAYHQEESDQIVANVTRDLALFDKIIMLPWGVLDIDNDGFRSVNPWVQLHFQGLLEGLSLRRIPGQQLLVMPDEPMDLENRMVWVLNRVNGHDDQNRPLPTSVQDDLAKALKET